MKFPTLNSVKRLSRYLTVGLVGIFFFSALFVLWTNEEQSKTLSGTAFASDGDSLRLNGLRIRLLGIDAPELDQTCLNSFEKTWPCGQVSRDQLAAKIANRTVQCSGSQLDQYDRLLATCSVNGRDLGSAMVREGLAISYGAYQSEQTMAESSGSGMWSGTFTSPRDWRNGVRQEVTNDGPLGWLFRWLDR